MSDWFRMLANKIALVEAQTHFFSYLKHNDFGPVARKCPHTGVCEQKTFRLGEPRPCKPAPETALQSLIWHSESLSFQMSFPPEQCFFTDTGRSRGGCPPRDSPHAQVRGAGGPARPGAPPTCLRESPDYTSKFKNDRSYLQEVGDWSVLSPLSFQKVRLIFWILPDVCETAILQHPTPDL